ncbi:MAG: SOS response-associated peptidase family protein [Ginsengibacter sp.]
MCYHISFEIKLESIANYFPDVVIDDQPELEFSPSPYINGFSHLPHRVMVQSTKDNKRHFPSMIWGILPSYVRNMDEAKKFWNGYKDDSGKWHTGYTTLNAMGEEMFEKKLYKDAALTRRCIVFVDGFYESYHYYPVGKKGQRLKTPVTYPFHIRLKDNQYPFTMFAGIWSPWKQTEVDKDTGEVITRTIPCFSIVTTVANELMAKIHNSKKRMPTILTRDLADEWLQADISEQRIKEIAMNQYPSASMEAFNVPKDFQKLEYPKQVQIYPELEREFC